MTLTKPKPMVRPAPVRWLTSRARSIFPTLLLFAVWEAAARYALLPATILVPPEDVFQTFIDLWNSGELPVDLQASGARVLIGFLLGSGAGFLFGLTLGLFPIVERYLGLVFHTLRQVPILAWGPMLIMVLGIGETFKIVIIAMAAFFPVALNTIDGIRNVPRQYRDVATVFKFNYWSLIRRIIVPAALPSIITGIRLALSRSWIIVVAAELFASNTGIGHLMDWGRQMFQLDVVMVGVLVTGIIGFSLDFSVRLIERQVSVWKPKAA